MMTQMVHAMAACDAQLAAVSAAIDTASHIADGGALPAIANRQLANLQLPR